MAERRGGKGLRQLPGSPGASILRRAREPSALIVLPREDFRPPARVARAARTRMLIPALRKCTEPSANRQLHPPVWELYGCRSLVQLIPHGPGAAEPSGLEPRISTGLALLAHGPPKENVPGTAWPACQRSSRPASSATIPPPPRLPSCGLRFVQAAEEVVQDQFLGPLGRAQHSVDVHVQAARRQLGEWYRQAARLLSGLQLCGYRRQPLGAPAQDRQPRRQRPHRPDQGGPPDRAAPVGTGRPAD